MDGFTADGFDAYDILGHRVLVGSTVPKARAAIHQLLRGFGPSPAPVAGSPEAGTATRDLPRYELTWLDDTWFVHGEQGPLHADRDFLVALGMLEWHLLTAAIERHNDLFHLHGAALSAPRGGSAVVLVGKSGSGKSTLTLALMQRGFLPFADDVALIEPATLEVRALRRAFHMSDDSLHLVETTTRGTVQSGGDVPAGFFYPPMWAPASLPVRWLLLLELRADETPRLTRLTPADAAVALLEQSLNLQQASRIGLATVAKLTAEADCYRFQHGNLPASLAIVERLVG